MKRYQVRPISHEELPAFAALTANAYPGLRRMSSELQDEWVEQERLGRGRFRNATNFGAFIDKDLVGVARYYNMQINLFSRWVAIGGLGSVAVDLIHKQQKVALATVSHFLQHNRQRGASLVALYPFRPDFYRKMGFGYGPIRNEYRIAPKEFSNLGASEFQVRIANPSDGQALLELYDEIATTTPGMFQREAWQFDQLMEELHKETRIILAINKQGQIDGYLVFQFTPARPQQFPSSLLANNLVIREWHWKSAEGFLALSKFLHDQSDQVTRVIHTTPDSFLFYSVKNPLNDTGRVVGSFLDESSTAGVGIMFRIISMDSFLNLLEGQSASGFPESNQPLTLQIHVQDDLLSENAGSYHLNIVKGRFTRKTRKDKSTKEIVLEGDISNLSSILLGCVPLEVLVQTGAIHLSPNGNAAALSQCFFRPKPLHCIDLF